MTDARVEMNPNKIVRHAGKPAEELTKSDLIKFIAENDIQMLNFRYVGGDGKLKTLNFVITSKAELDRVLSAGERVDGSSLFSHIDAASSDLYVVPRYKTAYVNMFAPIPTVDILCSYYTSQGLPLESSPENIVKKAHESLKKRTGLTFQAMGELEYYIFYERKSLYPAAAQSGYEESAPFCRWEKLRCETMQAIAQAGGKIKYGHSEVGHITGDGQEVEQHEIEFLPVSVEDAADQIVIAKWILRMIGNKYGYCISFSPKISAGHAGSGLHVHTKLLKDGVNAMVEGDKLGDVARKAIAGYTSLASSLTSFGNTVPVSYLRLVPHQEAPTNICWGDKNRSVLVRVPLGWLGVGNMVRDANPQDTEDWCDTVGNQTVEFRCPDGSANIYLLMAGLAVAARHGLEMKNASEVAEKLYVDVNIFAEEHEKIQERLPQLPTSCWESAECLVKDRKIYEEDNVFSPAMIDGIVEGLRKHNDSDLRERLRSNEGEVIKDLVARHLHCG